MGGEIGQEAQGSDRQGKGLSQKRWPRPSESQAGPVPEPRPQARETRPASRKACSLLSGLQNPALCPGVGWGRWDQEGRVCSELGPALRHLHSLGFHEDQPRVCT